MKDKMFDSLTNQSANLLAPSRELNKLIIEKLEQITAMQFASLREYTNLNLGQLKALSDISSAEDLKEFVGKQQELLKTLGEKMSADALAMTTLGKEFMSEAQKIVVKGVGSGVKGLK